MLTAEEAIEKFKEFERRASARRSEQVTRIKDDRRFLSGKQWDMTDDTYFPEATRPRRTINVLSNSINCTVNSYSSWPFRWWSPVEEADRACNAFLKFGANGRAPLDALHNSVAFGLGFLALGSEDVPDGEGGTMPVPALYSIEKVENVYWDPDSVSPAGDDAVECAIVEYRSKAWVSAKYGDEWVTPKGERAIVNVTDNKDSETMVIVTYYRVERGKCSVYRMLHDRFLDDPAELPLSRPPVFPVYGEKTYDDNDEPLWEGIVAKGKSIQKVLNYCWSQLSERLAMSPKPTFMTNSDAVPEALAPGYKTYQFNGNPLLLYKRTTKDGHVELKPPERIDNRVQFDDITGIIAAQLELLSTITGVDAKGIMPGETPQVTATQVLYEERQSQLSVRHFFDNMKESFRAAGECALRLLGVEGRVEVMSGPDERMQLQVARQELMQLMGMVPEDRRMQFVNGIFMSHPDNAVLRNVFGAINTAEGPSSLEQEAFQTVEIMKESIVQKDQEITDLREQIKNLEFERANNERDLRADFAKKAVDHQYKQEDMVLQARLDAGLDRHKEGFEARRNEIALEKDMIGLESARQRFQTDSVKAAMELARGMEPGVKKNED
jgi:hypothetical protein